MTAIIARFASTATDAASTIYNCISSNKDRNCDHSSNSSNNNKKNDCNYCNKNPQWGEAGADDDPRLDLDDRSDGPENINILHPSDGTFHVKVHYFEGTGAATATVTVWSYGVEVWSGSEILERNEVWDVGQVNWPDGTFGTANNALYEPDRRSCE